MTILLWLEGPFQSWGTGSLFYQREAGLAPTKSGVAGIICTALGRNNEQKEWLEQFSKVSMTVSGFIPEKEKTPVILSDFQGLGAGYDDKDAWETRMTPKNSQGKNLSGGRNKILVKKYIQSMSFACILESENIELMQEIANGMQHPVYVFSLGRKSCLPTEQVFQGSFSSMQEALERLQQLQEEKRLKNVLSISETEQNETDILMTVKDVPVCFGQKKVYTYRRVFVQESYM